MNTTTYLTTQEKANKTASLEDSKVFYASTRDMFTLAYLYKITDSQNTAVYWKCIGLFFRNRTLLKSLDGQVSREIRSLYKKL